MSSQGWGTSKEFLDVVKSIGEAKSKAEEERIVTAEIEILKKRIAEPDVPRKKMKEYIIRLVYVEMLGHDASFGYIHAVKMTHDDNLLLKKSGYLAVTLFLNEDHDLIILIVNTIQKDLRSDNYLIACAALTAVCKLINEETIPAVLPQVVDLLSHPKELVKKKAVMALHRFYQRAPYTVAHLLPRIQKAVDDNDPSVISAALCALHDLIVVDARPYKHMTAKFCGILKTVADHRLPKQYDYKRTPAPFIQIKILKILALLGAGDKATSEIMYGVLSEVLNKAKADPQSNIVHAIRYECMCTITSIFPREKLIEDVADITSQFLKHDNHNLKYMGIDSLGRIIKINPEFAEEHQQAAVIDCLEDPDDTLKRKTLDLLYKMTRATNVEVIVDCMITYMRTLTDSHSKAEIASRSIELAERFAPSNQWFIKTMNQVFELAGDLVPVKVAHDLMRLIAEGAGEEDEDADSHLRSSAVQSYLQVLGEPKLPSILLQVICWVLGEYGTADGSHSAMDIIGKLCEVIEAHPGDDAVKGYAVTAITKICSFEIAAGRNVQLISGCRAVIDELSASHSTDLQQRAYELQTLLGLPPDVVASVMPVDASCEDIEVDKNLSFLMGIVETALANGARPYVAGEERDAGGLGTLVNDLAQNGQITSSLKFEAYEKPTPAAALPGPSPAATSGVGALVPLHSTPSSLLADFEDGGQSDPYVKPSASYSISASPEIDLINPESTRLRLDGVQRKWGRHFNNLVPSSSSASYSGKSSSNGSAAAGDRGNPYSTDGHAAAASGSAAGGAEGRRHRETAAPPVSAAKQKFAASLFGGGDANSSSAAATGAKQPRASQKGNHTTRPGVDKAQSAQSRTAAEGVDGSAERSGRLSSQKSGPPPPPQADLVDLTDDTPSAAAAATELPVPTSDPFQLLEGLVDTERPEPTLQSATSGGVDLASLYESKPPGGVPSTTGTGAGLMDLGGGLPSGLLAGLGGAIPPGQGQGQGQGQGPSSTVATKGPGLDGSLQKDVAARQAGVIPTTVNPNMFKDLLG